jgi:uncharacterized protein
VKFPVIPAFAMLLAVAVPVQGQSEEAASHQGNTGQATIDSTRSWDFISKTNAEGYRIKVFVPRGKAPVAGFPVLYLLDGNILFGTFAGAIRNESQSGDIEPAVVVGIESGEGDLGASRTYDFTYADMSDKEKSIVVDLGNHPRFGGYDKFLQVIEDEIKPAVEKMVAVDRTRQALFGWSLGGQFVVHTMLKHPDSFGAFVALSPSLWRSNRSVFSEIDGLKGHAASGKLPSLFLGVGGNEEQLSAAMSKWPVDQAKFAAEVKYARMVGNVRDFANDIRPMFSGSAQRFKLQVFDGDTHNTVPWSAVNPVLHFLFADPAVVFVKR